MLLMSGGKYLLFAALMLVPTRKNYSVQNVGIDVENLDVLCWEYYSLSMKLFSSFL